MLRTSPDGLRGTLDALLGSATRELGAAVSRLRRRPGFAIGAAISLALGMALATAVFSMIDALFLRPLPYPGQDRLAHVYEVDPSSRRQLSSISARHFLAIRNESKSFAAVAASRLGTRAVAIGPRGNADALPSRRRHGELFRCSRTRPHSGARSRMRMRALVRPHRSSSRTQCGRRGSAPTRVWSGALPPSTACRAW